MSSLELLTDACGRLPHTARKMFGGHGFFAPNGGMFAGIVDDDRIILKLADDKARTELCALGTQPWAYHGKTGSTVMREWILVPDNFYDDADELASWVARAHKLAPAKGEKKSKPKTAPPKTAKKAPAKTAKKPAKAKAAKPAKARKTSAKKVAKKAARPSKKR